MMQSNKDKLINTVINGFQHNKGRASLYCFNKSVIPEIVYNVVKQFANKNPDEIIFIVVDGYETRKAILDFIADKGEEYNIRTLSITYVNVAYNYSYKLIITVGIHDEHNDTIIHLYNSSKFMLCINTNVILNSEFSSKMSVLLPTINTRDYDVNIRQDQIYSPVEETLIGVDLSETDAEKYDKYTDYINTSISIFGELSNIEKCKKGDTANNISAAEFRDSIAIKNGWSETLDTTIPFMRQIDDIYNPNVLYERACNFYNITKSRRDLLTDNDAKLDKIRAICEYHKDKQILIVSKRGEFAAKITKYLNENSSIKCADYHDCLDCIAVTNENGTPILIKSGVNKGKPKMIAAQAQSTRNESLFNSKRINALSIKFSSNTKLKTACDIVILTSSFDESIIDVKTRFKDVTFNGSVTTVYKLYCNNTIEADKSLLDSRHKMITVLNGVINSENNIDKIL